MDNVRIAILDAYDIKVAFMDNSLPEALHYYKDELHTYLDGAAAKFTFSTSAKHEDSQYLIEGNKLSFRYRDRDYYFNIVEVYRTEYSVEVTGYALMLELLNEEAPEYKAGNAMSFQEYLDVFDPEGTVELGVNEVSDKKIKNEWTGTSTILARIFSLANVFNAEAEFVPELNKDYSLKKLTLNVYRENDGECQGIGQRRNDITLRYGVNVKGIKKTSNIIELYTAIYPTGKDGLTIKNLNKKELDADGNVLFSSPSGDKCIRAVQARDRFPSKLHGNSTTDRYIIKRWTYETDNAEMLYGQSLVELKKLCEPRVTYEVDGYFDTDIGDTVRIIDEEYNPTLYLEARVVEQVRSFTDPTRNKTTFDNFTELESEIDENLLEKMNALIKANKVYTCSITTDNGIVFKNGEGATSLTANVRDAGADVTDTLDIQWKKDDVELVIGKTIIVEAGDVQEKAVYRFEALDSDGVVRGFYEVTVSNISDGSPGEPGENGVGIDSVVNKYAVSSSNTTAPAEWSDSAPVMTADNKYLWNYEVTTYTDGTVTETQKCVIGVYGDTGADGKGIKAISKYYLASAAASGVTASTPGWTAAMQATTTSKKYLWSYEVTTYTDSTTFVSTPVVIGTHGETGEKGVDGQMLYATSDTAEAAADKTATLVGGALVLKAGATVAVQFTYANTATAPTLNVNNTGAKAIFTQGVRYAYWSAGATVIFTYDGVYWRVASESVYADTVTIGNPGNSNIFIEGENIKFRKGDIIFASLSYSSIKGSTGAVLAADAVEIRGDPVIIGKQNGSVIVDCRYPQTGEAGFRVYATSSTAEFEANDLILHTESNDISLVGLKSSLDTAASNIKTLQGTGSATLSFTSSTIFATYGAQYVRRIGKLAFLHLCFSVTSSVANNGVFLAIPSGYRPAAAESNIGTISNTRSAVAFTINKDGKMVANGTWPSGLYEINFCYQIA